MLRMTHIKNLDMLLGHGNRKVRSLALDIVEHSLAAVDPYHAVCQLMHLDGHTLTIGDSVVDLSQRNRVYVLGAGKASLRIVEAIEAILGRRITDGVLAIKRGQPSDLHFVRVIEAGHPFPDKASLQAGREALRLAETAEIGDLVLTAMTGGSSALLCYPPDGILFEEKRQVHELLLKSGADIIEINNVRKHLSRVKGGLLARTALPAQLLNLTVSDVVGDHLDYIADPVVPDTSCVADAISVLKRYDLWSRVAPSVREHLCKDLSAETPKGFEGSRVRSYIVATCAAAAKAACERARELGFQTILLTTHLKGESREAAIVFASLVSEHLSTGVSHTSPIALIASGENTVTLGSEHGSGGPSQEFALSFARQIDGFPQVVAACLDTDGTDGPTEFAGALVDGLTASAARGLGYDVFTALKSHSVTPLLEELGDAIYTGSTGTNVSDLRIILIAGGANDQPPMADPLE